VAAAIAGGGKALVRAGEKCFETIVRIDTPMEAEYYRNGGILPYVLRQLAAKN
jgi:aconitate hydratase